MTEINIDRVGQRPEKYISHVTEDTVRGVLANLGIRGNQAAKEVQYWQEHWLDCLDAQNFLMMDSGPVSDAWYPRGKLDGADVQLLTDVLGSILRQCQDDLRERFYRNVVAWLRGEPLDVS